MDQQNNQLIREPTPQLQHKSLLVPILLSLTMLLLGLVGGYFLGLHQHYASKATTQPQNLLPTPSATVPSSKTIPFSASSSATDKTYTDQVNGISFVYPSDGILTDKTAQKDYEITINASKLQLVSSIDIQNSRDQLMGHPLDETKLVYWYDLFFKVYNNPHDIPLGAITTDFNGYATNSFTISRTTSIDGVSGTVGIWHSADVGRSKDVVLSHNGKIYLFEMSGDNGYDSDAGDKILDSVIESVHFLK